MKVHDIMNQPAHTCHPQTNLATVSRRMKDTAAGMLVVLDGRGRIAGVVTDRDLALAIDDTAADIRTLPIERIMTRRVHTCHEDDDLHGALARMASGRVRRLPVLNRNRDLQAVISIDDVILWAVRQGGVTATELASALRRICTPHTVPLEPEVPRF